MAFASLASDLVPNDTNGIFDIFIRDTFGSTTQLVSVGATQLASYVASTSRIPSMTPDGRYVLFTTRDAARLSGGASQVLLRHDRILGSTVLASVDTAGGTVSTVAGSISGDGRYVAFRVGGPSVVHGDVQNVSFTLRPNSS